MSNLNYQLYLVEPNGNYARLDMSDAGDMSTTIAISDISDITTKKDNITANITLPATKNNERIFGNALNGSRFSDPTLSEQLYFNYSLNSQIPCLLFENTTLITKGYLVFNKANFKSGVRSYDVTIVGNIKNFYSLLANLKLEDLDFSDCATVYNVKGVEASWANSTGVTFPLIEYGALKSGTAADINNISFYNFRPAIFLSTYLDKIFQQPTLSGYSYEVKGSDKFMSEFKHLIIPDSSDVLSQSSTNFNVVTAAYPGTYEYEHIDETHLMLHTVVDPLSFNGMTTQDNTVLINDFAGKTQNLFTFNRTLTTDLIFNLENFSIDNNTNQTIEVYLKMMKRSKIASTASNYNDLTTFSEVSSLYVGDVASGETMSKVTNQLTISQQKFDADTDFIFAVTFTCTDDSRYFSGRFKYTLNNYTLNSPSIPNYNVTYNVNYGDTIKPNPATDINQQDFIKSFTALYNLYTYSLLDAEKHIIFQPYDDYYKNALPGNLILTAKDWSGKIDYSQDYTVESYPQIPEQYTFTYKSDSDYYNKLYSDNYNQVYGTYEQSGLTKNTDSKKIELVFSPTPVVSFNGSSRVTPTIVKDPGAGDNTFKSNIRILYYNGMVKTDVYDIGTYSGNTDGSYTFTSLTSGSTLIQYPEASHFLKLVTMESPVFINPSKQVVSDLNFGLCKQYYLTIDDSIYTLPNIVSGYYVSQLQEYIDTNLTYLECSAYLTENDINSLDLKTPIYINNKYGNAYYKIIEVDYQNRYNPATLKLQKVII